MLLPIRDVVNRKKGSEGILPPGGKIKAFFPIISNERLEEEFSREVVQLESAFVRSNRNSKTYGVPSIRTSYLNKIKIINYLINIFKFSCSCLR